MAGSLGANVAPWGTCRARLHRLLTLPRFEPPSPPDHYPPQALWEGGAGERLLRLEDTAVAAGVLPGILRAELIEQGRAREATLTPEDLDGTVWFGNSLRGLIRAVRG